MPRQANWAGVAGWACWAGCDGGLGGCSGVFVAGFKLAITLTRDWTTSDCRERDAWAQSEHPCSLNGAFHATSAEREQNDASSSRSGQNYMCVSLAERRARANPWWGQSEAPFKSNPIVSQNVIRKTTQRRKVVVPHFIKKCRLAHLIF